MCVQFSAEEREQMFAREARLRPARAAEPGQGDPDAAPLRRVREACTCSRGCCRSPSCRAFLMARAMEPGAAALIDRVQTARDARTARCASAAAAPRTSTARRRAASRWTCARCAGISSYEPTELVVTVRAGTPLAELEAALAEQGQCLPFEPPRFGAAGTVGGMVAAGLAGPVARRRRRGARPSCSARTLLNGNGRGAELRRPGDEERRRLRRLAPARRLARHARA